MSLAHLALRGRGRLSKRCLKIQNETAALLRLERLFQVEILLTVMSRLSLEFLQNFMGYGSPFSVKFSATEPAFRLMNYWLLLRGLSDLGRRRGMVLALEPKKGLRV